LKYSPETYLEKTQVIFIQNTGVFCLKYRCFSFKTSELFANGSRPFLRSLGALKSAEHDLISSDYS